MPTMSSVPGASRYLVPRASGWTAMPVTADHSADVFSYPIGWGWGDGNPDILGTSNEAGTGVFGFLVHRDTNGGQALGVNEFGIFSGRVRYRLIITNPTAITNHTLPRLALELRALSWAKTNPLPKIGSSFFAGGFGTITGMGNILSPRVLGIQYEQEGTAPEVWNIVYTLGPRPPRTVGGRPEPGEKPVSPNTEEAPWSIGPDVNIDYSSEDFVLGLGKFVGPKTPAEMESELAAKTYAAAFGSTGGTFGMVTNSAGDPLESPPPMKVGNANIRIARAFQTLPAGLAAAINAATEQVCSSAVTVKGITFGAYTCKLSGATIAAKRWKLKSDWLPKQQHPLEWTYADVGWTPPTGKTSANVAINYTRNALPAFQYLDYFEVSVSIASRDLGWGYALIDKGYRALVNGKPKEITDFPGKQTHVRILAEGSEVDTSTGTADKKVLRLYQVLKTGTALDAVLAAMLG